MFKSIFRIAFARLGYLKAKVAPRNLVLRVGQLLIPVGAITLTFAEAPFNGLQSGEGTMTYQDGSTFVGAWKDGKKTGDGTLFAKDGTVYEGNWSKDDLAYGRIRYPNGADFTGHISNLKPHGSGCIFYPKGPYGKYSGHFKEGKYHGHGRLCESATIWSALMGSAKSYEGIFEDGKRHGFVLTRDEDDVLISKDWWENDVKVRKLD